MIRRLLSTAVLCLGFVAIASTGAHATGFPEPGLPDPDFSEPGLPGPGFSDSGIPDAFVVLFVLAFIAAIGTAIWRVSLARQMARDSGMDPGRATAMTLLSDDGLDATYLASNLRGPADGGAASVPPARTTESRLLELQELRDQGLVTYEEYEQRRAAILDSL